MDLILLKYVYSLDKGKYQIAVSILDDRSHTILKTFNQGEYSKAERYARRIAKQNAPSILRIQGNRKYWGMKEHFDEYEVRK